LDPALPPLPEPPPPVAEPPPLPALPPPLPPFVVLDVVVALPPFVVLDVVVALPPFVVLDVVVALPPFVELDVVVAALPPDPPAPLPIADELEDPAAPPLDVSSLPQASATTKGIAARIKVQ
jgi:hypothetical protein